MCAIHMSQAVWFRISVCLESEPTIGNQMQDLAILGTRGCLMMEKKGYQDGGSG